MHWTVVVVIGFRGFFQCGCGDWVWGVGAKICGFMVVVGDGLVLLVGLMVDFGSQIGGFVLPVDLCSGWV